MGENTPSAPLHYKKTYRYVPGTEFCLTQTEVFTVQSLSFVSMAKHVSRILVYSDKDEQRRINTDHS
jgi:hypothetical protein